MLISSVHGAIMYFKITVLKLFFKIKNWYLKLFTIEFIVAGVLCILSILSFVFIADETVLEQGKYFDDAVFSMMKSHTSPINTSIASFITFFGTGFFLIPTYILIIIYFIKYNKTYYAILVAAVAVVSTTSGWILKVIFHRSRPLMPLVSGVGGYSFPSGHSLGGFTFSGVIIYLCWQTVMSAYLKWVISVLAFLFGVLVGLSRIYLHAHFASDVLGSFFITLVWLSLSFMFIQVLEKKFPNSANVQSGGFNATQ